VIYDPGLRNKFYTVFELPKLYGRFLWGFSHFCDERIHNLYKFATARAIVEVKILPIVH
jgi:hypothetical protein